MQTCQIKKTKLPQLVTSESGMRRDIVLHLCRSAELALGRLEARPRSRDLDRERAMRRSSFVEGEVLVALRACSVTLTLVSPLRSFALLCHHLPVCVFCHCVRQCVRVTLSPALNAVLTLRIITCFTDGTQNSFFQFSFTQIHRGILRSAHIFQRAVGHRESDLKKPDLQCTDRCSPLQETL